jgi:hypothetical protein
MSLLTRFSARCSASDIQSPQLPTHLLVALAKKVCLLALLLKELHSYLCATALPIVAAESRRTAIVACVRSRILNRANKRRGPLVYQSFEIDIVDGGEGLVKKFAGERNDGDKVAVEKDCV